MSVEPERPPGSPILGPVPASLMTEADQALRTYHDWCNTRAALDYLEDHGEAYSTDWHALDDDAVERMHDLAEVLMTLLGKTAPEGVDPERDGKEVCRDCLAVFDKAEAEESQGTLCPACIDDKERGW
jgi:hypothetical protein